MSRHFKIPIDFVAGTHGNYLETVCNQEFGIVVKENNFTALGTSHAKSAQYQKNKVFDARHWFELYSQDLTKYPVVVSIQFSTEDLLLVSSVSMLRAGDADIDNDTLEQDTVSKLTNSYYKNLVTEIKNAYSFLDLSDNHIPRNILREFFKFGFRDLTANGYWLMQQQMKYETNQTVLKVNFSSFYNVDQFVIELANLAQVLGFNFEPSKDFYQTHEKFLRFNPYVKHKEQCDLIIAAITQQAHVDIPKLSLFQESYINGRLENIYRKEMPFHQGQYFTCTKDVLHYLKYLSPDL